MVVWGMCAVRGDSEAEVPSLSLAAFLMWVSEWLPKQPHLLAPESVFMYSEGGIGVLMYEVVENDADRRGRLGVKML